MAFNLNKLTEKAQEAVVGAQQLAEERRNTQVEPEHLLSVLVTQDGGVVPALLEKLGVQPTSVLQQLDPLMSRLAQASTASQVYVSQRFREAFEQAQAEAERLKDDFIST